MKKSPVRVIELFAYVLIIIIAVIWSVSKGGLNKPFDVPPTPTPTQQSQEVKETEKPFYNLPPKGEFAPK